MPSGHPANFIGEGRRLQRDRVDPNALSNAFIRGHQTGLARRAAAAEKTQKAFASTYDIDVSKLGLRHNYTNTQARKRVAGFINDVETDRKLYGDREALNRAVQRRADLDLALQMDKSDDEQFANIAKGFAEGKITVGGREMLTIANSSTASPADLAKYHNEMAGVMVDPNGHFATTQWAPFDYGKYAEKYETERIGPIDTQVVEAGGKRWVTATDTYSWGDETKKKAIDNLVTDQGWADQFRALEAKTAMDLGYDLIDPKKADSELRRYIWEQQLDPLVTHRAKAELFALPDDDGPALNAKGVFGKYTVTPPTTEYITMNRPPFHVDALGVQHQVKGRVEFNDYVAIGTPATERANVAREYDMAGAIDADTGEEMPTGLQTAYIRGIGRATINGKTGIWAAMVVPRQKEGSVSISDPSDPNFPFIRESSYDWTNPKTVLVPYESVKVTLSEQITDPKTGVHFDYDDFVGGKYKQGTQGTQGAQGAQGAQGTGSYSMDDLRKKYPSKSDDQIRAAAKRGGVKIVDSGGGRGGYGDKPQANPVNPDDTAGFIQANEGRRSKAYKDAGGLAVGIGFNLGRPDARRRIEGLGVDYDKLVKGDVELSDAQIDKLFELTFRDAEAEAEKLVPALKQLPAEVRTAVVDMSFQLGLDSLRKFEPTLALIRQGKYKEAAQRMKNTAWYKQTPERANKIIALLNKA